MANRELKVRRVSGDGKTAGFVLFSNNTSLPIRYFNGDKDDDYARAYRAHVEAKAAPVSDAPAETKTEIEPAPAAKQKNGKHRKRSKRS